MQSKIKADGTHVTTADGDAEIAIRQALGTARPDDGFIGEEIGSRPSRNGRQIRVSTNTHTTANRIATLPLFKNLAPQAQLSIETALGGVPSPDLSQWSQQMKVAEGDLDACIWFCGDTWDHAAPSVIVREAGGRFSDHLGGSRLDTRTGLYSNSLCHNQILDSLSKFQP
ncbi:MAG: inositol monophosphatase family protein [Acidimicrobiaceae bacterium]